MLRGRKRQRPFRHHELGALLLSGLAAVAMFRGCELLHQMQAQVYMCDAQDRPRRLRSVLGNDYLSFCILTSPVLTNGTANASFGKKLDHRNAVTDDIFGGHDTFPFATTALPSAETTLALRDDVTAIGKTGDHDTIAAIGDDDNCVAIHDDNCVAVHDCGCSHDDGCTKDDPRGEKSARANQQTLPREALPASPPSRPAEVRR